VIDTSKEEACVLVLIVDDMPVFREPIEVVLRSAGYATVTASNGQEALILMATRRPDLLLLDLGMPVMDGIEVLRRVRQEEALRDLPVIILTAEAERERVVEAAKLGIAGYVLKSSFSLRDLLAKIQALCPNGRPSAPAAPTAPPLRGPGRTAAPAADAQQQAKPGPPPAAPQPIPRSTAAPASEADIKSIRPMMTRAELLDKLKACEELQGFSPTVSQVLKLTASDRSSVEAVSKAISQDQAMALKILKLANSAVYTRGDRVSTVHKAVLRIGMSSIRQAVLNIGVVERFSSAAFREMLNTGQFWEHSIAVGLITAHLARCGGAADPESAFTIGLLHDLGRVVLAEVLGEQYLDVIKMARQIGAPLEQVETRMLALNHADVMDRLLLAWNFPKHFVEPIMHHHLSVGNARQVSPSRVEDILRLGLANRLAHALLIGDSGNETVYAVDEHCAALKLKPGVIKEIEETAREQTDETKFALLSHTNSSTWPRRSDELREGFASDIAIMCVSAAPETDVCRMLCEALCPPREDTAPSLAVVHCTHPREDSMLKDRLAAGEQAAGVSGLPVIVLSPLARSGLADSLSGRRSVSLATPLNVDRLIRAINELAAS
jgi:HD-like signal output (HDOD) protein/CheY-like chemotaxis protein